VIVWKFLTGDQEKVSTGGQEYFLQEVRRLGEHFVFWPFIEDQFRSATEEPPDLLTSCEK
jgi:hypothetical protein